MKNTFGSDLSLTIFGESHGRAVGAVLDGMAAGVPVKEAFLAACMDKRRAQGDGLSTLPRRHYINGLAEAVKAGLLADPELFAIFEKGDIDTQISEIIYRSLRFKKNVVEQDETERGMRKALNFGHTIGHGIEAVKGIKGRRTVGLFHGECVALGMLPMIESKALQKRVRAVYRRLGLPLRTTYNKEKVLAEMLHDKKAQGGQITIIKVPGLGCWRAETIPVEGLRPLLGMEE